MKTENVAQLIERLGVQRPYFLDETLRELLSELVKRRHCDNEDCQCNFCEAWIVDALAEVKRKHMEEVNNGNEKENGYEGG
jgi:hypothetical protein